jgi:hypothetical protein
VLPNNGVHRYFAQIWQKINTKRGGIFSGTAINLFKSSGKVAEFRSKDI